jgi:uroporphyrinogen decarboxylase
MDPKYQTKEVGKDVTLWGGGADTRHELNKGTDAEVQAHVQENIEILSKDGGFVFAAIHNIMPDVPPENIVAMFDTVMNYGELDKKGEKA